MRNRIVVVLLTLMASKGLLASPLGPMYPVIEPDLLEILTQHAKEEAANVQKRYEETKKRFEAWADRPTGTVLPTTDKERTWAIRPAIADRSILKGFERHWLLIDADRESHLTYARRFMKGQTVATHRVILVSGSVKTAQEALKTRVWFDQRARLVEKLGIKALPCLVRFNADGILLKEVRP